MYLQACITTRLHLSSLCGDNSSSVTAGLYSSPCTRYTCTIPDMHGVDNLLLDANLDSSCNSLEVDTLPCTCKEFYSRSGCTVCHLPAKLRQISYVSTRNRHLNEQYHAYAACVISGPRIENRFTESPSIPARLRTEALRQGRPTGDHPRRNARQIPAWPPPTARDKPLIPATVRRLRHCQFAPSCSVDACDATPAQFRSHVVSQVVIWHKWSVVTFQLLRGTWHGHGSDLTPTAMLATSFPLSSTVGGFSTTTVCVGLAITGAWCCWCWCAWPDDAGGCGGSYVTLSAVTGVMQWHTEHLTTCAPMGNISMMRQPLHAMCPYTGTCEPFGTRK